MPKRLVKPVKQPTPSRDDVIRLVGDIDDAVVATILGTGATYLEIEEAVKWATGAAEDLAKQRRELGPRAEAVYDILISDPSFPGIERER